MNYFFAGCLFWGAILCILYAVRPNSLLNTKTIKQLSLREKGLVFCVLTATVLLCILPMSLSPIWNGEQPEHRNQYEVMAESILDSRIDLDYGDMDPRLLAMENPYDPEMRESLGIPYHYDHAFYDGKYYMYFGVVPVFLLFLPFRLITGVSLTTYHATQVFSALFIAGLFSLFFLLARKFFRSMSWALYLSLSTSLSVMSVWYLSKAPALYCTAIAAGICMEIWSLFFFAKAVWNDSSERQNTVCGILGSLFGALSFGCRPTIAFANLLAVPMFFLFLKGKKRDRKLFTQVLFVFLPYVVIGILLMIYNNVRFGNPFEFGQTYQLTKADQIGYGSILSQFGAIKIIDGVLQNFFATAPLKYSFPFLSACSVFFNFPSCAVAFFCLMQKDTLLSIKKSGLAAFFCTLLALPVLITVMQTMMSPYLLERYRSDIYWLMGVLSCLSFGFFLETLNSRAREIAGFFLSLLSFVTIFSSFLLWMIPDDGSYTELFPEVLSIVEKILFFGLR